MAAAAGFKLLGHTSQGSRPDGVQLMVQDTYVYVGHLSSGGISVIDAGNPRDPRAVGFLPSPPGARTIHLQTHGDLLLAADVVLPGDVTNPDYYRGPRAEWSGRYERRSDLGLRIYDISTRDSPREIGFLAMDGLGAFRISYTGGRYAYVSASYQGFSDFIFTIVDLQDPTRPTEVGRWWLEGMNLDAGESPTWSTERRVGHHHSIVAGDTAYGTWRDGGLVLLDISEPRRPTLLSHTNWSPPFGGATHTSLPLPDRELVVVVDEATDEKYADGPKYIWTVDVRDLANPVTISTFPTPQEADYRFVGGRFGPHNLHENRPGSFQSSDIIFASYFNAGVRAYDIKDAFRPHEIGYYVPDVPAGFSVPTPQSCDLFVSSEGLVYVSDFNLGLHILEFTGD
jgi:hypothetical protein